MFGGGLTNNPFISTDPAQTRYPDLGSPQFDQSAAQYAPHPGFQQQPMYTQQTSFSSPQLQQQYSQSSFVDPSQNYTGMNPQPSQPFQPSSYFGQQLAAATQTPNMSGTSYGYLQGQTTLSQPQQYTPVQQQLQNSGYGGVAQFDPYSAIAQGWDGSQAVQQQQQQQQQVQQQQTQQYGQMNPSTPALGSPAPTTTAKGPKGDLHPREYIRTHKSEVEAWDSYAWKQLLNSFDALKDAWSARKQELVGKATALVQQLQYGGLQGYYAAQIEQEGARLKGLAKEADGYIGKRSKCNRILTMV